LSQSYSVVAVTVALPSCKESVRTGCASEPTGKNVKFQWNESDAVRTRVLANTNNYAHKKHIVEEEHRKKIISKQKTCKIAIDRATA